MDRKREPDVFIIGDNIFSPLGKTTAENFSALKNNRSGVRQNTDEDIAPAPFFASLFDKDANFVTGKNGYTKFEQLLIASITDALRESGLDAKDNNTVLIISSTKGNISLLEKSPSGEALQKRIALTTSAKLVADHFGFQNQPVVVSNACISGIMAVITGMRLLRAGQYENAVICGADEISKFIVSGFQSFQALSAGVCKPFDKARDGLNLGEGAATIILSINKKPGDHIKVKGGAVSNDANHISGPSRTGEELGYAISQAMNDAGVAAGDISFISAHGTATVYNDEMEANAIVLAGLQFVPLNSLKAHYGHTLGAAGLIESVISLQSLKEGLLIPTPGFNERGVTGEVNVCSSLLPVDTHNFLKTASGFGGCNAAVIFGK